MKKVALLTGFATTVLLAGCGGGGGGSVASTAPTNSTASGTAAYGKPISGGQIIAIDSSGHQCGSATTNADGTYAINLDCVPDPVLFTVSSGAPNGIPLDSLAIPASGQGVSGTVNITPLTTLILYDALASLKLNLASNAQVIALAPQSFGASTFATTDQQAAQTVLTDLATTLSTYSVTASSFNPVTTPFQANGTGIDKFFDDYPESAPSANAVALGNAGAFLAEVGFPSTPGGTPVFGGSAFASSASGGTGTGSASGVLYDYPQQFFSQFAGSYGGMCGSLPGAATSGFNTPGTMTLSGTGAFTSPSASYDMSDFSPPNGVALTFTHNSSGYGITYGDFPANSANNATILVRWDPTGHYLGYTDAVNNYACVTPTGTTGPSLPTTPQITKTVLSIMQGATGAGPTGVCDGGTVSSPTNASYQTNVPYSLDNGILTIGGTSVNLLNRVASNVQVTEPNAPTTPDMGLHYVATFASGPNVEIFYTKALGIYGISFDPAGGGQPNPAYGCQF
ncbi:MAG: hypothetical protein ACYCSS_14670 [Sulfuriferula sp.]